jgi:hypothetical protein
VPARVRIAQPAGLSGCSNVDGGDVEQPPQQPVELAHLRHLKLTHD